MDKITIIAAPTDLVSISAKLYKELQDRSNFLYALEAHGVDNWCGYCDAYLEAEETNSDSRNSTT